MNGQTVLPVEQGGELKRLQVRSDSGDALGLDEVREVVSEQLESI